LGVFCAKLVEIRENYYMSVAAHIKKLKEDHRKLDNQIQLMENTKSFDDADLNYLKKKKLQIKDEITRLTSNNKGVTNG
jgi:hypothetical protein